MPPPLGVKLTGYRLVFMATVFCFGTVKTILTYMGQSIAPTTLDWVAGTFLTVVLFWIGLYEGSNKWNWFFQVDYAPAIGYCAECMVGTATWVLFCPHNRLVGAFLLSLMIHGYGRVCASYFLDPPIALVFVLGVIMGVCTRWLERGVCYLTQQVGVLDQRWQSVKDFGNSYRPGTPRMERYAWFGVVGTMAGFLLGIALFFLPFAAAVFINPTYYYSDCFYYEDGTWACW